MVNCKQQERFRRQEEEYKRLMKNKKADVSISQNDEELNAGEEMEKFKENNRICKDCKEPLCFGINDKWLCAGCPELPREYNKNGKEKEKQSS